MRYAPGTWVRVQTHTYLQNRLTHTDTQSEPISAAWHLSQLCSLSFSLLWLRLLRTDRPDTEPSHRDAEQWWRMNTCERQSKCSFIIANSIWEMDVCPPDARVSPALHSSFNLSCRGCKCDANVDRSRMVRSAETWRNYLASVLIFVTSQLADVTEDRISNRCPCWYAKGRKGFSFLFSSAPSLFSLTPLFFLMYFLSIHFAFLFFPVSREWWQQRRAEGVSSSRSQRCCLSERTPSASRCPSRMFPSSCGALNPLPHVR